ncbi:MAG TPA: hypothetical protein VGP47_08925 [Parachlamydiaceae bacterium]|nr:hypothetical protein [Nitrosopumilus sp.]HEV8052606.1 hypothetical protein [Parachlamydiaceae bacterium]
MNSIQPKFPNELLNFFQDEIQEQDNRKLINFFKRSTTVCENFLNWTAENQKIVDSTEVLIEAKEIAKSLNLKNTAESIDNLRNHPYTGKRRSAYEINGIKNFSLNNVETALVLHNLSFIDDEHFIKLFNKKIYEGDQTTKLLKTLSVDTYSRGATLLFEEIVFEASLKFLETLTLNSLYKCLSARDIDGNTPLFNSAVLLKAMQLLRKLVGTHYKIFTLLNKKKLSILHINVLFKILLPLLQELYACQNPKVFKMLSILDENGNTPLHSCNNTEAAMSLLTQMNSKELFKVFSIQNNEGSTPLHFRNNVEITISLLEKLNWKDLDKLISIKNLKGKTPRDHIYTLNKVSPLLDKIFTAKLDPSFTNLTFEESIIQLLMRERFERPKI